MAVLMTLMALIKDALGGCSNLSTLSAQICLVHFSSSAALSSVSYNHVNARAELGIIVAPHIHRYGVDGVMCGCVVSTRGGQVRVDDSAVVVVLHRHHSLEQFQIALIYQCIKHAC